ncbi:exportin-7-like [Notechis scutatus]|uniref:Exportin-7-like n=1 Tax=Notechis scutatus TaxID=8663 RepID=A0A6J1W4B8_9SAUR|nr:exportin-7-like [Notechis scutatus]
MLSTVLNIIIFEDCRNQWSMSRPLLGLILLNEKYFSDLRNGIVNSQPPEKQQAMHLCFENLMEGIERNLLTKNRDRSVSSPKAAEQPNSSRHLRFILRKEDQGGIA